MNSIFSIMEFSFHISFLYNADKYISFGFQSDYGNLQTEMPSNSPGHHYTKHGLYSKIETLHELSIFPYLKRKASDYRFPIFGGLGLHGNFESNINLLNYIIIPNSSAKLSTLFLILDLLCKIF